MKKCPNSNEKNDIEKKQTFKRLISNSYWDKTLQKRRKELIALHKEHETQIIFASRLVQGKPKNIQSNWPTSERISAQITQAKQIYSNHLIYHFFSEEEVLFNRIKPFLTRQEEFNLLEKLESQHREIKKGFSKLDVSKKTEQELQKLMRELGLLLFENSKTEEEEFLPLIEKRLPDLLMKQVSVEIDTRTRMKCNHLL